MNTKRATFAPYLMLVFALIGVADASYDSYAIYTDQLLWCPPPIDGCNTVASSPYARIDGIPLGYLGLVYYLCMFAIAALLALVPSSRPLRLGALLFAGMGSISLDLLYVHSVHFHSRFLHLLPDIRCLDASSAHRRTCAIQSAPAAGGRQLIAMPADVDDVLLRTLQARG